MTRSARIFAGVAVLAGCSGQSAAGRVNANSEADLTPAVQGFSVTVQQDLAELRAVTAPFHDFDRARAAGWSTQITACMTDPGGAGGMGFHYGKTNLINGSVSVDQPQLLLFEPEKNGRLRLVAAEYIIPYTFVPRSAAPPVLFGQQFKQFDAFQLWGLHVWAWKNNPSGLFATWNPLVTCDNAAQ
ncbi:MAG TPA: hypothetical protein VGR59_15965 [Gemmatimonadaceae bacterium]|nr:hypothetical protein [Gemmatimonadaceae bacterium]